MHARLAERDHLVVQLVQRGEVEGREAGAQVGVYLGLLRVRVERRERRLGLVVRGLRGVWCV